MNATLFVDASEFKQALSRYVKYNRRARETIVLQKGLDIAFKAFQLTRVANKNAIKALKSKSWWTKYVSGYFWKIRGHSMPKPRKWSDIKYQMRLYGKAIIEKRIRGIGYARVGFLFAASQLWPLVRKGKEARSGSFRRMAKYANEKGYGKFIPNATRPAVEFASSSGRKLTNYRVEGLEDALKIVAIDMESYIARKTQEAINKANGIATSNS